MAENDSPEIIVVRQQERGHDGKFYFHPNNEYSFYLSAATGASSIIGTLPAGKKFKVRTIVATSTALPVVMILTNGSGLSYTKLVFAADETGVSKVITDVKGLVFDDDPYLMLSTFATAVGIFLGGELDPDEDAA